MTEDTSPRNELGGRRRRAKNNEPHTIPVGFTNHELSGKAQVEVKATSGRVGKFHTPIPASDFLPKPSPGAPWWKRCLKRIFRGADFK